VASVIAGFRMHGEQKTAHHMDAYRAEAEGVLRRQGFRRPGRVRDFVRRNLTRAVGARPLVRLPEASGRMLARAGLVAPAPVVWWRRGWEQRVDYVL
jgi:hypothetical protein